MKIDHKKWKNIGWNLVLSKESRKICQEMEDLQEQRIMRLQKEVEELREKNREWQERFEQYKESDQRHEAWLKQRFTEALDQFDATNFLPHLPYLKGLHFHSTLYKNVFPGAQFLANIDRRIPYPAERIREIRERIEANMEEIPPCLIDDMIQKYYRNDEDMVIVRVDHAQIIAGVYDKREAYEEAKAEKSEEMDRLIDQMSR